jgi:hypothetical protein
MLTNPRYNHTPPLPVAYQLQTVKLFLLQNNTLTPYLITVNASECFDSQLFVSMPFVLIPVDVNSNITKLLQTSIRKVEKVHFRARSIPMNRQDFKRTSNFLGNHNKFSPRFCSFAVKVRPPRSYQSFSKLIPNCSVQNRTSHY